MDSLYSMLHSALSEASESDTVAIETYDSALTYRALLMSSENLACFLVQHVLRGGGEESSVKQVGGSRATIILFRC